MSNESSSSKRRRLKRGGSQKNTMATLEMSISNSRNKDDVHHREDSLPATASETASNTQGYPSSGSLRNRNGNSDDKKKKKSKKRKRQKEKREEKGDDDSDTNNNESLLRPSKSKRTETSKSSQYEQTKDQPRLSNGGNNEETTQTTSSVVPASSDNAPCNYDDQDQPKRRSSASRKRKKKRRQRRDDATSSSTLEEENRTGQKKKKKKKRNDDDGNETQDLTRPTSPVLEGAMISQDDEQFVLIDRVGRKVYSSMERLENGDRKQIGELDDQGQVVVFKREKDSGIADSEEQTSNGPPDCKESDPASSLFPYETDPDDHCESPLEAYEDILSLLQSYARRKYRNTTSQAQAQEQLSLYDPYYCNGRVAEHLKSLGFPTVYNRKEDCYQVWKDVSRYPKCDLLITNPPYSEDHVEKLMEHVTRDKTPWMLLMPTFVHKKDYFQRLTTASHQQPIYLVPRKRYIYQPPPNFRSKKASDTHKKSSPFVSMWYLWGGSREVTDEWYRLLQQQSKSKGSFDMARSKSALRDLRRKSTR